MAEEESAKNNQDNVSLPVDGLYLTTKQEAIINQGNISQLATLSFTSREELLNLVRSFFLKQGYGLKIKSSRKDRYVSVGCDRGGHYRDRINVPLEKWKRNTTTRLINCPFEIKGKKGCDNLWRLELQNITHNHEASEEMSGHPSARVLSNDEVQTIDEMTKSGAPPRQIMSYLRRRNPCLKAVARNIYNTKAKILKASLGGRSNIQVLLEELGNGGFLFDVLKDEEDHLTHVFFAHPNSIQLSRSYSNVFVMDCTYKTNRYNMPLLEVIGITSFNTSFYSCFIFLKSEGLDDYLWALNLLSQALGKDCQPQVIVTDRELALMRAIEIVFPKATNILCIWHIEKNICANCKNQFEEQKDWESFLNEWNMVIYSSTIEAFERSWADFEQSYDEKKNLLNYIKKTWLLHKEKFVSAWTEKYLHFGNRASSRAEGAHSKLKKYLLVSTGDLRSVKEKMCQLIENDIQEIKTKIASEKLQVPLNCGIPFFKDVVSRISLFAMKLLHKQFEIACNEENHSVCSGTFSATMGLPCAHAMKHWMAKVIPLETIHSQWRIDSRSTIFKTVIEGNEFGESISKLNDNYHLWSIGEKLRAQDKLYEIVNESSPILFEPNIQRSKGRPRNKNKSSTKRNLSQFEIVEKSGKSSHPRS